MNIIIGGSYNKKEKKGHNNIIFTFITLYKVLVAFQSADK